MKSKLTCYRKRSSRGLEISSRPDALWRWLATASTMLPHWPRQVLAWRWASGTEVAPESADVVLLGNDLVKFTETLKIARWTRRIIWWNFAGTIGVDLAGMALAAAGLLSPTLAAFIHVTSELTFILNSARLLPRTQAGAALAEMRVPSEHDSLAKAA